jgi:transposase
MSEAFAPPSASRSALSRAATREVWLDRLARFPASGLTVAQFCAIEAVSLPSFYSWKRRLATEALGTAASPERGSHLEPRLLPVQLQSARPVVELVLPTGTVLRLPHGCDLAWVRSLVAALGDAPC